MYSAIPVSTSSQMIHLKAAAEVSHEPPDESMSDDEQVFIDIFTIFDRVL